jgi:hypothetical protein
MHGTSGEVLTVAVMDIELGHGLRHLLQMASLSYVFLRRVGPFELCTFSRNG